MPRRQQHVEQPADPGPVGGGPVEIAGLREEVVRNLDARQMPEQHALRVQRPLRLARGAGRVDDERRVVRAGAHRRELVRSALERLLVVERAVRAPAIDHEHELQVREPVADGVHLGQIHAVGDQRPCTGVLQAEFERVLAEQHEQRDGDQPRLVERDVGDGRFRRLREQHPAPIAGRHPVRLEHVREPVRGALDVEKAIAPGAARFVLDDEGKRPRVGVRVPVAGVDAHVVEVGNAPLEARTEPCVIGRPLQHVAILRAGGRGDYGPVLAAPTTPHPPLLPSPGTGLHFRAWCGSRT